MSLRDQIEDVFEHVAAKTSAATGSFWAFAAAFFTIIVWSCLGPVFHYSETWQLVINTATTIITFLMVFVIQHAQNKDTRALHLKLNELIAAIEGASNRLIDVESLSDREIEHLNQRFHHLHKTAALLLPGAKTTIDQEADDDAKAIARGEPVPSVARKQRDEDAQ